MSFQCTCGHPGIGCYCSSTADLRIEHGRVTRVDEQPAVDLINHPPHYNLHPSGIECIEVTRLCTYTCGNAIKYVWRTDLKNGKQDLEKAIWYLEDAVRHADPVFLPGKYAEALDKLHRVMQYESDHNRLEFFGAMAIGAKHRAIESVRKLLAA